MSSRKPRKGLSDDDREVWNKVAKTVERVEAPVFTEYLESKPRPKIHVDLDQSRSASRRYAEKSAATDGSKEL